MKERKLKLSVCITRDTLEIIEELARLINLHNLGWHKKSRSISSLVEELLVSGYQNRGKELWKEATDDHFREVG